MPAVVLRINPKRTLALVLSRSAEILKAGGVAVVPSDTVYGLAASVAFPSAVKRIAERKGRKLSQPFSIFVSSWKEILRRSKNRPKYFFKLKKILPGPYTFVLPARGKWPPACLSRGKVGLRWPGFPLLAKLVRKVGTPLVATSANRSGQPPLRSGRKVIREFAREVDLILDAGKLPLSGVSTVVEFRASEAVVLRRGEGYKKLEASLNKIGVPVRNG